MSIDTSKSKPLRVGLNLIYLAHESGGAGTYARELVPALLEEEPGIEITAFVGSEVPGDFKNAEWATKIKWVHFPVKVTGSASYNMALSMGVQWAAIPMIAARRGIDVIHGLANITPPLSPRVATVATLLDLIWLHHPDTMSRFATLSMKLTAPISARRATRVIAISNAAKTDIQKTLGISEEKIDVTHLGIRSRVDKGTIPVDLNGLKTRLGIGQESPIILCVAQKRRHKNLLNLVRSLVQVKYQDAVLVLVGSPTPHEYELRLEAERLGLSRRVIFPRWLEQADLDGLYGLSSCFVLPSFEEGFGLPILEAMERGIPVACSNCSSLPEVAGEAALLFDPHQPVEIAGAIDRLLGDSALRANLREKGKRRAADFTWRRTAQETLRVYRRAVDSGLT